MRSCSWWLALVSVVTLSSAALAQHATTPNPGGIITPQPDVAEYYSLVPAVLRYDVEADADDGTEVNDTDWYDNGYAQSNRNRMGAATGETYDVGLRFHVADVRRGESFVYARLVFPATGDGQVDDFAAIRVVGVDQDSPSAFSVARPSELPKTTAAVDWDIESNWPTPLYDFDCSPLYRYSPNIAAVINEIVSRPGWGSGVEGKTLALVLEDNGSTETNFLAFQDYRVVTDADCPGPVAPTLELYRTVRSTFLGKELLGRPTDESVTVNAFSLMTLDAYFEYGTDPNAYDSQTTVQTYVGGSPMEAVLDELLADTRYYYRLRYRTPGQLLFAAGPQGTFHTQRAPGSAFTFAIQSDAHLQNRARVSDTDGMKLYRREVRNIHQDNPDFLVDLGDTFHCEFYVGRDVIDFEEAVDRHLAQRPYLDLACGSAPFFFVIGNHEGEQGWRLDGTPDNVAVWAANARKLIYPLPAPDDFYTGCTALEDFVGLRENYYAWEWGDALFVVLDPYWYTTVKPHSHGGTGSGDNWDWTLGYKQYDWLRETLEGSSATFKFVFAHQVTGGVNTYGRGGIEAASHSFGGCGSFEWGGEDLAGKYVFDTMRPGWGVPVHELMVNNGVTIFFHGHDHVFVKQDLDGVVYQECPQPSDADYSLGFRLRRDVPQR